MFSQYTNPQQSNISVAFINSGKSGAQAFTVGAGNTVFLIDFDHKQFFIKEVSPNGFPQPMREFNFEELVQQNNSDYVTRKEFEELKNLIKEIKGNDAESAV